jgi:class 3 adenylate cyclase/tetratricopeptide (TPR) repeat protein
MATAAPAGEERKVVSVLFVDLVGFTARSDRADPEDVRATLRVFHSLLRREIERWGGTVEKFIGDAVMAVFGAPVAHEDDPERAVRAALRILEAIEELNEERPGLDLAVRGAVNTGEAVVSLGARPEEGEGFVTGGVVNVASRLQGVAPVGGIVVGELTYRATRDRIIYEEREPISVKGREEPLPTWRALEARSRFGIDIEPGSGTPMIGRERELSLLADLFERVVREQAPHLVTLSGEPGVGKSRLVREFRTYLDDLPSGLLVRWRQGRCLPYGEGITFWALGEVVKSHAGILENDDAEQAAAKLALAVEMLIDDERERDWVRSRLAPLVGIAEEAAAERDESFAAWRTFLEAIAAQDPFVLVIEDLHWADQAMLAFAWHLADWASGVPLFVLCTARPELYEREPSWGGGTRNHTAVSLSPLSELETAQLLAALLEQAVLPAETQRELLVRAGGNPLYAEEFVRMLVDRGILLRRGASWELAPDAAIPAPENVQELIAARLDTLPPDRKALLQDAAVLGKVFWAGAVAEMGGREPKELRDELHELSRKELVRPARRPSIEGEAEYAFQHILIRDVAYGQIPRAARTAKHRAAAVWIERVAGERVADSAELLAYHYEQAVELARATGEDVAELEALARRFLLLAAERASRLDLDKAMSYYRRAVELTPPGHPERVSILLHSARAAGGMSIAPENRAWVEEALALARTSGDALREGEALGWLANQAWYRGETALQFEYLERAIPLLEAHPPGPELAFAYSRMGAAYGLSGQSEKTMEAAERAFPIVGEHGSQADLAVLHQFRGQARLDRGDLPGGFEDLREGLRIALESSPAALVAAAHVNLGDNVWFHEGPEKGLELCETAAQLAERRGALGTGRWARMQSMWTRFDLGRWDELLEIGERLLPGEPEPGSQISILVQAYRRDVLLARGVEETDDLLESVIVPRAREIADGQVVVPVFRVAALDRLARGDLDGAVGFVVEADGLLSGKTGFRSWMLDGAARVCLTAGAVEVLRSLVGHGIEHMTRDANSVRSAKAALAEAEGDLAVALERYEEAAKAWGEFPHVLEHAFALEGASRCLLLLGRPVDAAERATRARRAFAGLRADRLVAETDELLARAAAKSS